jgi:serine phosphatase RsbU (regulator of sigma subunit)
MLCCEKEQYGKKRVRKSVESYLASGPEATVKGVIQEFLAFNGQKALDDDVTIAVAQILAHGPGTQAGG